MVARSSGWRLASPALTTNARKFCTRSTASPSVDLPPARGGGGGAGGGGGGRGRVQPGGGPGGQCALVALNARQAVERAFGLRGGHRVVAGPHHALARGQVLLQVGQLA